MAFLDSVLNPLLRIPVLWLVIGMSILVSLMVTLIYKYTTNQELMKKLKGEIKSHQEMMKSSRDNPAKLMEINKKAMDANMQYMGHSMKSTLFTFIPVIILFSWMSAHLAYEPIAPGTEFKVTAIFDSATQGKIGINVPEGITLKDEKTKEIKSGKAEWLLEGKEGKYYPEFQFNDEKNDKEVIISTEKFYSEPVKKISKSQLKEIVVGNAPIKLLNLFGWKIGWLGTYIIFSIIFSILSRKVLKVY